MTFLSLTPDAYGATASTDLARQRSGAPVVGQAVAMLMVVASLTVPSAVAKAKWLKLTLIAAAVEQRCLSADRG